MISVQDYDPTEDNIPIVSYDNWEKGFGRKGNQMYCELTPRDARELARDLLEGARKREKLVGEPSPRPLGIYEGASAVQDMFYQAMSLASGCQQPPRCTDTPEQADHWAQECQEANTKISRLLEAIVTSLTFQDVKIPCNYGVCDPEKRLDEKEL